MPGRLQSYENYKQQFTDEVRRRNSEMSVREAKEEARISLSLTQGHKHSEIGCGVRVWRTLRRQERRTGSQWYANYEVNDVGGGGALCSLML